VTRYKTAGREGKLHANGLNAGSGNSAVIVAELHDELAGYVELTGGAFRRNRATARLVIGVLAEASGGGVGAGLLQEAKRRAAAMACIAWS
jgi:GNAT superfamily N-acetyltransferase